MGYALPLPLSLFILSAPPSAPGDGLQDDVGLAVQVEAYFRSTDADERARLIDEIDSAVDGDVAAVVRVIGELQLWAHPPHSVGEYRFATAAHGLIRVAYSLPDDYDPAHPHPLLICQPDRAGGADAALRKAKLLLGRAIASCILIAPDRPISGSFHQSPEAARDFPTLVVDVRRRFHTDADATFLLGVGGGADAAWQCAVMHADLLAGLIAIDGKPDPPYPMQVYPFLLKNLHSVRVCAAWVDEADATREETTAAHNRASANLAARLELPLTAVRLNGDCDTWPGALARPAANVLASRRPASRRASHWFRYPGEGESGWVRQTRFAGDVWNAQQISIMPSPTTDHAAYITKVIQSKMAYLGGEIEGQSITIQTRRCAKVDLLFSDGAIDFSQPVTIRCNGKQRRSRRVTPSIRTLLARAYAGWDFQRPVVARLGLSIRTDAKP